MKKKKFDKAVEIRFKGYRIRYISQYGKAKNFNTLNGFMINKAFGINSAKTRIKIVDTNVMIKKEIKVALIGINCSKMIVNTNP
jgi:hypothetical protein